MKRTGLAIAIAIAAIAGAAALMLVRSRGDLSVTDARRLVAAGAALVDVRTPDEFAAGHIAGALNIPLQDFEARMSEVGSRDRPVVLYCRSGNRSGRAATILRKAGFASVHNLGAMSRW